MATSEQAVELLSSHGVLRPQSASDWTGTFPLPNSAERFYQQVGPVDLCIEAYGNPFFLPSLAKLWKFQAGYRWNGLTGEPIVDWDDDWLVVADEGGDPFILSRASGAVLYDQHGGGAWSPSELFPDLNTMAACLGQLGAVVALAGERFTDDGEIRAEYRDQALADVQRLLGSTMPAERVLEALGWS